MNMKLNFLLVFLTLLTSYSCDKSITYLNYGDDIDIELNYSENIEDNFDSELLSLKPNDKIINTIQQLINGNISDIDLDNISLDNKKKISKFLYQKLCFY